MLKASISFDSSFNLRLPRTYYCTLEGYSYSDKDFLFRFQLVERENEVTDEEKVLFESNEISGGPSRQQTYNNVHSFSLGKG